jgi:hypothetical protein
MSKPEPAVSARRRLALFAGGTLTTLAMVIVVSIAARQPAAKMTPQPEIQMPDTLSLPVGYVGVGAEGVDMIWRGRVTGPAGGQLTIRLEYAGITADRQMPIWPVNAWLFYSADNYRASFAAEVSGSMNWRTGEMRVTGLVSDGFRMGAAVEQRMQVGRPGLDGSARVVFLSSTAVWQGILLPGSGD